MTEGAVTGCCTRNFVRVYQHETARPANSTPGPHGVPCRHLRCSSHRPGVQLVGPARLGKVGVDRRRSRNAGNTGTLPARRASALPRARSAHDPLRHDREGRDSGVGERPIPGLPSTCRNRPTSASLDRSGPSFRHALCRRPCSGRPERRSARRDRKNNREPVVPSERGEELLATSE